MASFLGSPALVGREAELAELELVLSAPPAVVLVEGEAGIGKSRLVREFLARRSGPALVASCPPFREPHTLGPVVDALHTAVVGVGSLGLSPVAGALRALLPEWTDELPPTPEPLDDARAARHRLFRALAEVLERLGSPLLVVEDAHWADEATLEFLLYLTSRPESAPDLLLTVRPDDVPEGSLLTRLSSRAGGRGRIVLEPLDLSGTAALVESMLPGGRPTAEFAGFMHRNTAGIPLAIEESVRLMHARADVTQRDAAWMRRRLDRIEVPATIRDSVLERAGRLEPEALALLRAAAVLGDATDPAELAVVAAAVATPEAADLAETIHIGLLQVDAKGRYGFRHLLAAQAVYHAIPEPYRRTLHAAAAAVLERRSPSPVGRLARHYREAGDSPGWIRYAMMAADRAIASGDESAAATLLFDLLEHAEPPPATVLSIVDKVPYAVFAGPRRLRVLVDAMRAVLDAASVPPGSRGLARFHLGRALLLAREPEYREEFEAAVKELPAGSFMAGRAMICLGEPHFARETSLHEHLRWLRSAERVNVASEADQLNLTMDRAARLLMLGEPEGWRVAERIPAEPSGARAREHAVRGAVNLTDRAIVWGRHSDAVRWLETAHRLQVRYELDDVRDWVLAKRARLDFATGAWSALAERLGGADRVESELPRMEMRTVRAALAEAAGGMDRGELVAEWAALAEQTRPVNLVDEYLRAVTGLSADRLAAGDPDGALAFCAEPVAVIAAKGVWIWGIDIVPSKVDALVAAGRTGEAAELVRAFGAGLSGRPVPAAKAALTWCRARLAQGQGRHDRAAALFLTAAARWQAMPRPHDALLARERAAACLAAAGHREAAMAEAAAVVRGLAGLGARVDANRVLAAARDRETAAGRPRRGGRPSYGDQLSPREWEVARLVCAGRTNPQIAAELVLSAKTVTAHVQSAMRKLGVSSRTALAVAILEGDRPG
ncbi:MAG TPA: AAA family ATPase [Candidatus Limnocylindrales bacterium]